MSSQRTHETRSRHDGHAFSEDSSTTGGSSRFRGILRAGGWNEQGDAGRLQPGEEKKNKWSSRLRSIGLAGWEDEDTAAPSYEYQDGEEKHLRERTHQLEERIDQQARLISRLRSDIENEVEKSIEIKQSADRMAYSMENKELSIGRQDSDEDIYTRFRSLIGQIKTWSVPFAHGHQEAGVYSMETIEEFRKISPGVSDIRRFLRKPRNVRLLVRGYVGFVIAKSLCRRGEDVWMDRELAHSFATIENSLSHSTQNIISDRELHDWRALTAALISRLDPCDKTHEGTETAITVRSRHIMSLVANWVAAEDQGELEDGLRKILLDAVKLSQTLRCQRAFWSIRQAGPFVDGNINAGRADSPFYFNEVAMDDKHGDEDSDGRSIPTSSRKLVEIIISPSLWKRGNTDGERYNVEFCVERSEVKCKEIPFNPDAVTDRIQPS